MDVIKNREDLIAYFKLYYGLNTESHFNIEGILIKYSLNRNIRHIYYCPKKIPFKIQRDDSFKQEEMNDEKMFESCLLYTSPSPRDRS